MKKEIQEIKDQALIYLAHDEHFKTEKDNEEMLIFEVGRGLVDRWNKRKVKFIENLISSEEIEAEKANYIEKMKQDSISNAGIYHNGMEIASNLFKNVAFFQNFEGKYNEKAKIKIPQSDKRTGESWEDVAVVWVRDIFPKTSDIN